MLAKHFWMLLKCKIVTIQVQSWKDLEWLYSAVPPPTTTHKNFSQPDFQLSSNWLKSETLIKLKIHFQNSILDCDKVESNSRIYSCHPGPAQIWQPQPRIWEQLISQRRNGWHLKCCINFVHWTEKLMVRSKFKWMKIVFKPRCCFKIEHLQ